MPTYNTKIAGRMIPMRKMKDFEFWFVTGSQHLYGPETLRQVAEDSAKIVDGLNASGKLPCKLVLKDTVKTPSEITSLFKEATYDDRCAGVITWMHIQSVKNVDKRT